MAKTLARSPEALEAYRRLAAWADGILVISRKRDTERREHVARELDGLPFEFLDGADKDAMDRARLLADGVADESRTRRAFRSRWPLPLGHICCSLSHRRTYETMVARGWKRMVVFEDDVVALEGRLAHLPAVLDEIPQSFELVYFGYSRNERTTVRHRLKRALYVPLSWVGLSRWRPGEVLRLLPRPYSPHLRVAGYHMLAHAYAVSLSAAEKLIRAQTPVAFTADQLLAHEVLGGRLEAYVAEPQIFAQLTQPTTPGTAPVASLTAQWGP